jgi:hypothetical protein
LTDADGSFEAINGEAADWTAPGGFLYPTWDEGILPGCIVAGEFLEWVLLVFALIIALGRSHD